MDDDALDEIADANNPYPNQRNRGGAKRGQGPVHRWKKSTLRAKLKQAQAGSATSAKKRAAKVNP